jgi:hypothetical protein
MSITTRDVNEIQRAHDVLVSLVLDEKLLKATVAEDSRHLVVPTLNVLCWILNHEHNNRFADDLAVLERQLDALGVVVLDLGSLHEGERPQ